MRRIAVATIAGALLFGRALEAQLVPGRDLLSFPLGLAAEAPAFGANAGFGLWNPASVAVPSGHRLRLAVGTMSAPVDLAVSAQLATAAGRWRNGTTVALSIASAAVTDLLRTDSDPQSIGDEIPYTTTLISAIAARPWGPVTVGLAARVRTGRLDNIARQAISLDAGVITKGFGARDIRLAASTFLASPFAHAHERAEVLAAVDGCVMGVDSLRTARAGLSLSMADGMHREVYGFASARWSRLEARGGVAHTTAFGHANWRSRLGIVFRHRGYTIGVAREQTPGTISETYQFTLSSVLK